MNIAALQATYSDSSSTPEQVIARVYDDIARQEARPVWISLVPREQSQERVRALAREDSSKLPLFGVPFAVKDNIDVAGMETTAGCPAYAYPASETAFVVQRLEAAGAILIGKTNMDQFATGLVGTRSPYGVPHSVFGKGMISGGSSSGSAVAVAKGLVSFALGTDTAGSGRVPAMFNNLVGLKPTRGVISTRGIVPACRSLDCVSVFAETAGDAAAVLKVATAFDEHDVYARSIHSSWGAAPWSPCKGGLPALRIGVLRKADRQWFGDELNGAMYEAAIVAAKGLGAIVQEIDVAPFLDAAKLLYGGPWIAERYAALGHFAETHAPAMDPTVRTLLLGANQRSAAEAFAGAYELERLRRLTEATWRDVDLLLLPTAPRTYTVKEIDASPIERNSHLGTYTNFVNLLDLAAVAVPAGMRSDGLPFGVSLISHAFTDPALLLFGDRLHRALSTRAGGSERSLQESPALEEPATPQGCQLLAVVGAHLSGQPLNWQLTERRARLLRTCRTHPDYRFYALKNTTPLKPGLVWAAGFGGPGIEVEVWAVPAAAVGSFVEAIPSPLGIGTLRLEDGSQVKGFIVEPAAVEDATEITSFGGWRAYLSSLGR